MRISLKNLSKRDYAVLKVLWRVLFLNWAVAMVKIIIGIITGRLTILADGLHSILDGANNIIGILAINVAAKPPDSEHPYGHRKFENVAAMLIGGLIVLIAWELGSGIIHAVWEHLKGNEIEVVKQTMIDWGFAVILLLSIGVNFGVSLYEYRKGEKLNSVLLKADAGHTRSDMFVTALSLASLILGGRVWWVDPLLALGVMVFLARTAWGIIADNLNAFTDRARLEPDDVINVLDQVDGVIESGQIRSHVPENDIHLDLTIKIDRNLTAEEAELIEHAVRLALFDKFPGLTFIAVHHTTQKNKTLDKTPV
jgi:cation diffusion facilitator family transporter